MENKDYRELQDAPEVPVIIIERDDEPEFSVTTQNEEFLAQYYEPRRSNKKGWVKWMVWGIIVVVVLCGIFAGYRYWAHYYNLGVRISVTPEENIEKLKQTPEVETPFVEMKSDSVLGVALDIFAIHGLQGTIEFQEPDTADTSVYLYCRSSDFKADGRYIGTLVSKGIQMSNDNQRLGYMAMANGVNVIGIARSEAVKDYVIEQRGSFFRQFVLVSDGELPPRFHLHGKVERCALGRMGDRLYFISSRHKETMWSFADALREYGFTDAIYITGGKDYTFYRDQNGVRHDIHNVADYPHKKWKGIIPWLVFRKSGE